MDPTGSSRSHRRTGGKRLTTVIAALAVVAGLMVATGVALAAGGGSTCQQYNPQTCNVVTTTPSTGSTPPATTPSTASTPPTPTTQTAPATQTSPTVAASGTTPTSTSPLTPPPTLVTASTTAAAASKSSLPFTGLDLGLIVGAGLLLIAGGFVVRRMSRRIN